MALVFNCIAMKEFPSVPLVALNELHNSIQQLLDSLDSVAWFYLDRDENRDLHVHVSNSLRHPIKPDTMYRQLK